MRSNAPSSTAPSLLHLTSLLKHPRGGSAPAGFISRLRRQDGSVPVLPPEPPAGRPPAAPDALARPDAPAVSSVPSSATGAIGSAAGGPRSLAVASQARGWEDRQRHLTVVHMRRGSRPGSAARSADTSPSPLDAAARPRSAATGPRSSPCLARAAGSQQAIPPAPPSRRGNRRRRRQDRGVPVRHWVWHCGSTAFRHPRAVAPPVLPSFRVIHNLHSPSLLMTSSRQGPPAAGFFSRLRGQEGSVPVRPGAVPPARVPGTPDPAELSHATAPAARARSRAARRISESSRGSRIGNTNTRAIDFPDVIGGPPGLR